MRRAAFAAFALGLPLLAAACGSASKPSTATPPSEDARGAIDRPLFESPDEARDLLPRTSLVVGLAEGDTARAYPLELLSLHGVVNDTVAGRSVAIVWDPFVGTALAFQRGALHLAVSPLIAGTVRLLEDRETGTLWNPLLAAAVRGSQRGRPLVRVPVVQATWGAWLAEHPETRVLSIRRDAYADRFLRPFDIPNAKGEGQSYDPYEGFQQKVVQRFPGVVAGLPGSSRVLGLVLGGRVRVYPERLLVPRRVLSDVFVGEPLLLAYDGDSAWASAFSRKLDGRTLSFKVRGGVLADVETGSRWSARTGRALAGPLAGRTLERLPSAYAYWFAWVATFPAPEIYEPSGPKDSGCMNG